MLVLMVVRDLGVVGMSLDQTGTEVSIQSLAKVLSWLPGGGKWRAAGTNDNNESISTHWMRKPQAAILTLRVMTTNTEALLHDSAILIGLVEDTALS